jgi:hypothetical protein
MNCDHPSYYIGFIYIEYNLMRLTSTLVKDQLLLLLLLRPLHSNSDEKTLCILSGLTRV